MCAARLNRKPAISHGAARAGGGDRGMLAIRRIRGAFALDRVRRRARVMSPEPRKFSVLKPVAEPLVAPVREVGRCGGPPRGPRAPWGARGGGAGLAETRTSARAGTASGTTAAGASTPFAVPRFALSSAPGSVARTTSSRSRKRGVGNRTPGSAARPPRSASASATAADTGCWPSPGAGGSAWTSKSGSPGGTSMRSSRPCSRRTNGRRSRPRVQASGSGGSTVSGRSRRRSSRRSGRDFNSTSPASRCRPPCGAG